MERKRSTPSSDVSSTSKSLAEIVSVDTQRLGGEPVFKGTRVPIRSLFEHLKAGDSLDTFLDDFEGVTRGQAEAVIEMAKVGLLHDLRAA